jgi:bifunctional non-homologous end joining protein LigD
MDIFEEKGIKPMLIAEMQEAFDSEDFIFELKLDGIRCIAYLDKDSTDLRNKRDFKLIPRFPELDQLHRYVNEKCYKCLYIDKHIYTQRTRLIN